MKRGPDTTNAEEMGEEEDCDLVGPSVSEAVGQPKKRRKKLKFESVYLRNIPSASCYEKSFMHRDTVTHVIATKTDFIVTGSCDGHVKFWKKLHNEGIEFVKHFRAHMGRIVHMTASLDCLLATVSDHDKSMKVFEINNFDMISMFKLQFAPLYAEWIFSPADPVSAIAVSDAESEKIFIFDGRGGNEPVRELNHVHSKPVHIMRFNPVGEYVISADKSGFLEFWNGAKRDYGFPEHAVDWKFKTDTDLYEFAKTKTHPTCLTIAPNGRLFATFCTDRKIRIFRTVNGKLFKVIDESLSGYIEQKERCGLSNAEFNRRIAIEKDMEKGDSFGFISLLFDESGNFLIYSAPLAIKVVNLKTNKCVRTLGMSESLRFLSFCLCRALPSVDTDIHGSTVTAEMQASDNPSLQRTEPDPMLVCTANKKNRFYLFTNSEPFETKAGDNERDVLNEKPKKEDIITALDEEAGKQMTDYCIVHTTMGDIHCKLFLNEAPKAVENFCTHAREGYFNGHIFHRVIKSFMIQTGDPTGTGTGGESIWGHDFEDEFHPSLKHDRPYMMCMANAGPNTNGSQFFITVVPTPWLENKHTIFGKVVRGMEVAQNISKVKTNPRNDKPHDEVAIISVTLK